MRASPGAGPVSLEQQHDLRLSTADMPLARSYRRFVAACALLAAACGAQAQEREPFRLAFVTFLTGFGSETFGLPAAHAALTLVEQFNAGAAPAPYAKRGFGGLDIELVLVDEAGGPAKQVQELRDLVQREQVDAVVGYITSRDCAAVAPVADELRRPVVLMDCGTPRLFEESARKFVFRTASHAAIDNVSLVRYLKARGIPAGSYNLVNPDYPWGRDARADFRAGMAQLLPGAKAGVDLLPKLEADDYAAELAALAAQPADVTHSSLWGPELQAFLRQGQARGAFGGTTLVLSAADHALPALGRDMPDGVVFGARGAHGVLAEPSALNAWFTARYAQAHAAQPLQSSYRAAQALMGLKLAVERAMARNGGRKPTSAQIADALRGSRWPSPAGPIRMALGGGQQAIQGTAVGRTRFDAQLGRVVAVDVMRFAAECVNPPPGMTSADWLQAGFPGARCD
jgi:branched-chain amino acid transport system substrate-binding protein